MPTEQETLIAWLNDAYGMENALVQVLEHQVKDASEYPQVQARLEQHLAETRRHAEMVKESVERLGGSTSSLKSGLMSMMGQAQALSTGAAKDEMIKNALQDFAAENFEVASYTSLIAAAQAVGDQETVSVCQQILQQDRSMAAWLEQNIPALTTQVMQTMAAGART